MRFFVWILTGMCIVSSVRANPLGLADIYRLASSSDPEFRAAEASHLAKTEGWRQSVGAMLPALSVTGQAAKNVEDVTPGPGFIGIPGEFRYSSDAYVVTLRQPLLRMDLLSRVGQSHSQVAQSETEFDATRQSLIVDLAERYFEVLAAQDNIEFANAEKTALAEQLQQVQARVAIGVAIIADLREVEAGHDLVIAQAIAADSRLASAEEALRERAGDYKPLRRLKKSIPLVAPGGELEDWVQTAEQQNPRLLAARHAVTAASKEISRQRAGHWPALDLVASHGETFTGAGRFGDSDTTSQSIALQLTLPIYQGGQVNSRVREAAARHAAAREHEEKQRRAVVRATTDAYRAVHSAMSRVNALAKTVESTSAALKAAQVGYQAGTRTVLDVLETQRTHFRAQRDHAFERYEYVLSTLRLREAAGALSPDDLNALAAWLD